MKKTRKHLFLLITAALAISFVMGCQPLAAPPVTPPADTIAPTVLSTVPINTTTGVAVNGAITAVFNEAMDPATVTTANFTLKEGLTPVAGTVIYIPASKTAVFTPTLNLIGSGTVYTATVTTAAKDLAGNGLIADKVWSFTTTIAGLGPAPVNLGLAGTYAVLAKSAISTVPASAITGDVGISPAAETYITGFSQTDATGYAISPQVTGFIFAADMAPPTPINLTTAVLNMEAAYTDAAGRPTPDFLNLGTGNIGGMTLVAGLYNWGGSVTIPSNMTISGAANDIWIFQITGDLIIGGAVNVTLSGGAQAKNIFWQVAGQMTQGIDSHFEGIVLSQTAITLANHASVNGRLLAQTQVALDQNTVTKPAP